MNKFRALFPVLVLMIAGHRTLNAQPARDGYVATSDSVRLYYRVIGSGRDTIVVLHGGPGMTMDYLIPDFVPLSARHTLIAYDQRGSGRSTAPLDAAHITLANHVSDLEAIRRRFALSRMTIIGHSWGGRLAALYASRHPDEVARLILVDPGPARTDHRFAQNLVAWMDSGMRARGARLGEAARAPSGDRMQACQAFWHEFIRGYWSDPNDTIAIGRMRGTICAYPTAIRDMDAVGQLTLASVGARDYSSDMSVVKRPVLIVAGHNSPMPLENSEAWASAFPDARLLVVDRSGHFPHVEQPRLVFDAVETFLKGGWPPAARKVERRVP